MAKCWPARSKLRADPRDLSEGLGLLSPKVDGTASGWFHRTAKTSLSRQWRDNRLLQSRPYLLTPGTSLRSNTNTQAIRIATLEAISLLARQAFLTVHAGKFSSGALPHSLLLPYNEREVPFFNIPFFAISPSKLLYERFRLESVPAGTGRRTGRTSTSLDHQTDRMPTSPYGTQETTLLLTVGRVGHGRADARVPIIMQPYRLTLGEKSNSPEAGRPGRGPVRASRS
ncbi:hypothetical protein VIGAN_04141900 [Vigna angularis var. angularis]|uniref:Uncharacterized protein n=1 Tax=Vigna angularis var. angularis TaxID=157739 RepID=A0A0S3RU47_PHAAN|nr:hypothetical protein VIGAN_04141900 [Vigna angularis var. angularis]